MSSRWVQDIDELYFKALSCFSQSSAQLLGMRRNSSSGGAAACTGAFCSLDK